LLLTKDPSFELPTSLTKDALLPLTKDPLLPLEKDPLLPLTKEPLLELPAPLTKPDPDSEKPILSVPELKSGLGLPPVGTPGTLGTPCLNTRGYSRKKSITYAPSIYGGTDLPVPSVPGVPDQSPKPYIDADGNLRIPFDSPERYHWWKGGWSITETLSEVES
jgi:hypothetical protein